MKTNKTMMMLAICIAIIVTNAKLYAQGKERKLASFNELNLGISGELYLKQGTLQKVQIQASDKTLELIETEVKDGVLNIKWNRWNVSNKETIKIYITMVDINAVRVSGSGDINSVGPISSNNIDVSISGSGNININELSAENIKSSISGSADISLAGKNLANQMSASISGSGNIKAQDLAVKNVEASISGSGDCSVKAMDTLRARIAGSGNIYYKGNATIDGKFSGSGSIKHIN